MTETIKTFIINRDLISWPKAMIEWIKQIPYLEPIILDNNSSYPPLLEWYDTNPCKVIRLKSNYGHKVLWTSGLLQILVKEKYYILTDPDLDLSRTPLDVIDVLKEKLHKYNLPKIGLAINIDDMPQGYPLKEQVLIWETPFWQKTLEDNLYDAPIDTTFALHETSKCRSHIIAGARLGGEYTTKHLPFYLTEDNITEELAYYFEHSDKTVSSQARYLNSWVQESYAKLSNSN